MILLFRTCLHYLQTSLFTLHTRTHTETAARDGRTFSAIRGAIRETGETRVNRPFSQRRRTRIVQWRRCYGDSRNPRRHTVIHCHQGEIWVLHNNKPNTFKIIYKLGMATTSVRGIIPIKLIIEYYTYRYIVYEYGISRVLY